MTEDIPDDACCLDCRYPLRTLTTNACPECGRQFDRGNPTTYRRAGHGLLSPSAWAKPPSLWTIFIVILLVVWNLTAASDPFWESLVRIRIAQWTQGRLQYPVTFPLFWSTITVIAADSIIRLIALRQTTRFNLHQTGLVVRRRRWRWAAFPIAMLIIASPRLYNWPLKIRFELSRTAFEREIAKMKSSGKRSSYVQSVGLYRAAPFELSDEDWDYLAQAPAGQTPNAWVFTGHWSYHPVGGYYSWYDGVMFHYCVEKEAYAPYPSWTKSYHPELSSPPWHVYVLEH